MVQRDARQALVCPQETEAENVAAVARRLVDAMGRPAGRAALWPSDVPGRRVDHEFSPKARSRPSARASLEAQRSPLGLDLVFASANKEQPRRVQSRWLRSLCFYICPVDGPSMGAFAVMAREHRVTYTPAFGRKNHPLSWLILKSLFFSRL